MGRGTVVAVGLCVALAAPLSQAENVPIRGPVPFTTYDKDKSGGISREEFYSTRGEVMNGRDQSGRSLRGATASAFDEFDTDHDLQLSKSEFAQAQRVQMQPRSGTGASPGAGPGSGQMQGQGRRAGATGPLRASFADYDLNSDGQITPQEFNEARAKRIEERAQAGGQMRNLPNAPTFGDLDTNHDGIVTAEEFIAHQVRQRNPAQ